MEEKIGRNDPCHCGSGKKYKKCCWLKEMAEDMKPPKILQLKIQLNDIKPQIWRTVLAEDNITFSELHEIIQIAMGWDNYHMYDFTVSKTRIEADNIKDVRVDAMWAGILPRAKAIPASRTKLSEFLKSKNQKFSYLYDFGDSWAHTITVERILEKNYSRKYPTCIDGARACPPEDCGGVHSYKNFLRAIRNPKHNEHKQMLEWIGGEFDAEHFDINETNKSLGRLR